MNSYKEMLQVREADAEYFRDLIRDISNGDWKAVRRADEGTADATDEMHAWARQQLAQAEDQIRLLKGEGIQETPGA